MAEASTGKTVALPAVVDLDAIDGVRDGLLDAIEQGAVLVDGHAVERVSTNALLMLISAAETARRNSFPFAIAGASAPMLAAIDLLGLRSSFSGLMRG
ncbi:MAG: STAS domain-containing protein [Devosia sp.]